MGKTKRNFLSRRLSMPGPIQRNLPAFVAVAIGVALRISISLTANDSHVLSTTLSNSTTRRTRATTISEQGQGEFGKHKPGIIKRIQYKSITFPII